MLSAGAISQLSDNGVRANRQWTSNQLYSGYVKNINDDGSLSVVVNNRTYQALPGMGAQPGDFLSLRLLGTQPEPHFAVVSILRRASTEEDSGKTSPQAPWQEAVSLLRNQQPGVSSLNILWQHYPEQLARFSFLLPVLLSAMQNRNLSHEDLGKADRLKAMALSSGSQFDQGLHVTMDGEHIPDLKGLLLRLLAALQNHRQLVQHDGKAILLDQSPSAAQSLQDKTIALYTTDQGADPVNSHLKQLVCLNAENALLQIVNGQLSAVQRTSAEKSSWIMQLVLNYAHHLLPMELEISRQMVMARQIWTAVFSIDLPRSGRMQVAITVKKPAVSIHLQCSDDDMQALCNNQRTGLRRVLGKYGLNLEEFSCDGGAG